MTQRDSRWRRLWRHWAFRLGLIVLALFALRGFQQRGTATGTAPEVSGTDLDGKSLSLAEFRGGPVLVHFWATWCEVCRTMEDNLQSVAGDYPVVTVASMSGGRKELEATVKRSGRSAPVLVDPEGNLARTYGVNAFPTSFFIDGQGQIRFVELGYTTELGLRIRLWLLSR